MIKNQHQRRQSASKYSCIINTPVGKLGILVFNSQIVRISYLSPRVASISPRDATAKLVVAKMKRYFLSAYHNFNLPISLKGTPLQKKIWRKLLTIPMGQTITYGRLAEMVGTSPRVIGNACCANPIPIIVPCHRVVSASGIGGYSGKTNGRVLEIKEWLLQHEGC